MFVWFSVIFVFVATFLLALVATVVASLVLARQQQAAGVVDLESSDAPALFKVETLSSISLWDWLLTRFDFVEGLKMRLSQADLDWTVGRLTSMMMLIGIVTLVVLSSVRWLPGWIAFGLACVAALTPYFYVQRRRRKRFAQFEEQLPEAMEFLARALRAGHPFSMALELLANEDMPPLAAELRLAADERKLGSSWEDALRNLTRRVPLLNVRLMVAAILLQTRAGGKLSEVLTRLAETMREAVALQGEVRAIAAHGRVTGAVLTILPLGIALMMTIVSPGYLNILVEGNGPTMITIAAICLVAAHFVIRKIVDVKI